jgi:hypothetical protein
MRAKEFTTEGAIGTHPKRPARPGSRPDRGHTTEPRYKEVKPPKSYDPDWISKLSADELNSIAGKRYPKKDQDIDEQFCEECGGSLAEHGKASRELCKSSKPDTDLGASMLSSCKSQGLRARDGEKSHKLGKDKKSRIKVGGHRIKGQKYGGPLPDWS